MLIKLFGHRAQSAAHVHAVTGPAYHDLLSTVEREYNDGGSYVLHDVTARVAYNIARAAVEVFAVPLRAAATM